jgi:hypothetical protein
MDMDHVHCQIGLDKSANLALGLRLHIVVLNKVGHEA